MKEIRVRHCVEYHIIHSMKSLWVTIGELVGALTGSLIRCVRNPQGKPVGRALIIYITDPFKRGSRGSVQHSNMQEAIIMADVLSEIGFYVDVMDYRNRFPVNVGKYDLIIGFGDCYEKIFYTDNKAIKIYYATGAPQSVHCFAEVARIRQARKKNRHVFPKRVLDRSWPCSELLSNAIISVTDGWAMEQFSKNHPNVYSVPVTSLCSINPRSLVLDKKQDNRFVWFGSRGALHKGLDLCLEAVANMPDVILHVCGFVDYEPDFVDAYKKELRLPNIRFHGFLRVDSNQMRDIMSVASYVILPSCSEGCATSVLTCMSWGCIPVVSEQSGITFENRVLIEELTTQSVRKAITKCLSMSKSERVELMRESAEWIRRKHSIPMYKKSLMSVISKIMKEYVREA